MRADGRDLLVMARELDAALRGLRSRPTCCARRTGCSARRRDCCPRRREAYDEQVDLLTAETVPDVNHYTILFDPTAAARVAAVIAGG